MATFQELMATLNKAADELSVKVDFSLLEKVAKGLGPSIYKADAKYVACSSNDELERIKKNFLIKKLELPDSSELDSALKEVCEQMGTSNRTKERAVFYTLLVQKFAKQNHYS